MSNQKDITRYGKPCSSDNAFTRKARLHQSMYRVEIGEEEGVGPTRFSMRKYGNMINGGEISGKNFLMKETFEYAKYRVKNRKENETIDEFRLFNNLLSSMPMAFNLFYPLMLLLKQEPAMITPAIKAVFKQFPIFEVTEIGLEFIPTPIEKYTKDKSAMDAYIKFQNDIYFWKIDYYDINFLYHSPDPSNTSITDRVLTIMHADEY